MKSWLHTRWPDFVNFLATLQNFKNLNNFFVNALAKCLKMSTYMS